MSEPAPDLPMPFTPDVTPIQVELPFDIDGAIDTVLSTGGIVYNRIVNDSLFGRLGSSTNLNPHSAEIRNTPLIMSTDEEIENLLSNRVEPRTPQQWEMVQVNNYSTAVRLLGSFVKQHVDTTRTSATSPRYDLSETDHAMLKELDDMDPANHSTIERVYGRLAVILNGNLPVPDEQEIVEGVEDVYGAFEPLLHGYNKAGLIVPIDRPAYTPYMTVSEETKEAKQEYYDNHLGRMEVLRRNLVMDFFKLFGTDSEALATAKKLNVDTVSVRRKFVPYNSGLHS